MVVGPRGIGVFHDRIFDLQLGTANTTISVPEDSVYAALLGSNPHNLPCPADGPADACYRAVYTLNDRYFGNEVQLYLLH